MTLLRPDFSYEDMHDGIVCGIDEVGRGPLAGPVVAAAVILHRDRLCPDVQAAINDSKKLSAAKRTYIFEKLQDCADISIAECSVEEIDQINILQASLLAMRKACMGLSATADVALVDGNKPPKLSCKTLTLVKGDSKSLSIAAASIVAKHYRDEMMKKLSKDFPQYGWERNAGYGTREHLQALEMHGITPLHRRSFAPVHKQSLKESSVIY